MAHILIPEKKDAAVVIGGINTDIWGRPSSELIMRDSNPGHVSVSPGGVGRNIAHDLRLLGASVSLCAALGDDTNGRALSEHCAELGIDMSLSRVLPGQRSSTYLYITDEHGDMQLAVNDMDICSEISPAYLETILSGLESFSAVVIDCNLSEEAIAFLCGNLQCPLYADTVSTVKARKLIPYLCRFRAIKPNAAEAEALTGESDPARAAVRLIEAGVQRVFISLGAEGMIAAEGDRLIRLPAEQTDIVNTNGAGDAATAAMVLADMRGMSLEKTLKAALLAGACTCMSQLSNAPGLSGLREFIR